MVGDNGPAQRSPAERRSLPLRPALRGRGSARLRRSSPAAGGQKPPSLAGCAPQRLTPPAAAETGAPRCSSSSSDGTDNCGCLASFHSRPPGTLPPPGASGMRSIVTWLARASQEPSSPPAAHGPLRQGGRARGDQGGDAWKSHWSSSSRAGCPCELLRGVISSVGWSKESPRRKLGLGLQYCKENTAEYRKLTSKLSDWTRNKSETDLPVFFQQVE
ncbi:uncharacterized protein LOC128844171 [Malaclemys terrapin pileata]|uniref:uncharacterized protein LOC128844171 n=1 Tax=Malaclemys terrapin pileata TaxID=2991368 RepID=UPI0023A7F6FC|nr:uncharacterized protein LOC128844171 [Malaclemys terrapin pileata]